MGIYFLNKPFEIPNFSSSPVVEEGYVHDDWYDRDVYVRKFLTDYKTIDFYLANNIEMDIERVVDIVDNGETVSSTLLQEYKTFPFIPSFKFNLRPFRREVILQDYLSESTIFYHFELLSRDWYFYRFYAWDNYYWLENALYLYEPQKSKYTPFYSDFIIGVLDDLDPLSNTAKSVRDYLEDLEDSKMSTKFINRMSFWGFEIQDSDFLDIDFYKYPKIDYSSDELQIQEDVHEYDLVVNLFQFADVKYSSNDRLDYTYYIKDIKDNKSIAYSSYPYVAYLSLNSGAGVHVRRNIIPINTYIEERPDGFYESGSVHYQDGYFAQSLLYFDVPPKLDDPLVYPPKEIHTIIKNPNNLPDVEPEPINCCVLQCFGVY